MDSKLPNHKIKKGPASEPKARVGGTRKPAHLRTFPTPSLGQRCPGHCPGQPGAILREHGLPLGQPLDIRAVAKLIGSSPWSVRQTLIPRGLPHFRLKASGRLIFYHDQVIRWIESQQQGG